MATFNYNFAINRTQYFNVLNRTLFNDLIAPRSSNYTIIMKRGDTLNVGLTGEGSRIGYVRFPHRDATLPAPNLSGPGTGTNEVWSVQPQDDSDHFAQHYFFMRNAPTAANRISFRVLILPTTFRWGTVPDMVAGVASSVTVSMPASLEPFMVGTATIQANGATRLYPGNEEFIWKITKTSHPDSAATSDFVQSSGTIFGPQNGSSVTVTPKSSASGTYYIHLYHTNAELCYPAPGGTAATNPTFGVDTVLATGSFTVSSGATAPTISVSAAADSGVNGYMITVTTSGGSGTFSFDYFGTRIYGTTFGPFNTTSTTLAVGGEWQGSTWTVTPKATSASGSVNVGTPVSVTLPTLDLVVSVPNPAVLLNSTSTRQDPVITGTSSSTRYFIKDTNHNLLSKRPLSATGFGGMQGDTYDMFGSSLIFREPNATKFTGMSEFPNEGTAKTYHIYAYPRLAGFDSGLKNFVYTGLSFITERPDTNVQVSTNISNLTATNIQNLPQITVSNGNVSQNQYRLITLVGKYEPSGRWAITFNTGSATMPLPEFYLPEIGEFIDYQLQVRIPSHLGGAGGITGTTANFQNCPGATFRITRSESPVAPTAVSLAADNPDSATYTVTFKIDSGSGGGTLQAAIVQGSISSSDFVDASSDTQSAFTKTFTRGNTNTIRAQARRSASSTSSVLTLTGLGFLPSDTNVTVSAPTQVGENDTFADVVVTGVARSTEIVAVRESGTTTNIGSTQTGNNVTLRIPNANLPTTTGSSKNYIIVTQRPLSTGGDGSTFSEAASFTITRSQDATGDDTTRGRE